MLGAIVSAILWFIGLFTKSKEEKERDVGEKLGRAETERDNAVSGLAEVQRAVDAKPADPGGVRDGSDPAAGRYRGGPD
jgi:hypothetical protein